MNEFWKLKYHQLQNKEKITEVIKVKVKQSRYRPGVGQRVPVSLDSQIT